MGRTCCDRHTPLILHPVLLVTFTVAVAALGSAGRAGEWVVEGLLPREGSDCTVQVSPDGTPYVAYARKVNNEYTELELAHRSQTGWSYEPIERYAYGPSIAFDSWGRPHVAYVLAGDTCRFRYAVRTDSGWDVRYVGDEAWYGPFLQLDSADRPHIVKTDGSYIRYLTLQPDGWNVEIADSVGLYTSADGFVLDRHDNAHVTYMRYNYLGELCDARYALRTDRWTVESILEPVGAGILAVDILCRPHIAIRTADRNGFEHWVKSASGWEMLSSFGTDPGIGLYGFQLDRSEHAVMLLEVQQDDTHYIMLATEITAGWVLDTVCTRLGGNIVWPGGLALGLEDEPHIVFYDNNVDRVFYAARAPAGIAERPTRESSVRPPALSAAPLVKKRAIMTVQSVGRMRIDVFDSAGRHACEVFQGLADGRRDLHVDVSDLPAGVYFLRLTTPTGSVVKRVTVLR